ncbi:hypothetical protein ES703_01259 [subsurface metagenome]|nr:hypothetical protein [bacterium]
MLVLVVSDLHGHSAEPLVGIEGVDLLLMLGDVTTGAGLEKTKERIQTLRGAYPALYVISGNWERPQSAAWFQAEGLSLDGRAERFNGLLLFGLGGSIPTPFNTPNEFTEDELADKLTSCPEPGEDERLVICSHNPPYGACDRVFLGKRVGSKSLRAFIEKRKPDLVLCGHIHEARGIENIGSTIVLNPGSAPKHYALIRIEKEISVNLY